MDLEQLLRQAWNSGMGSYHDTKTSKQLKVEEDDFIDSMEDELNLFSIHNVSGSLLEFNDDVDRMIELYKAHRYTQAEQLRDELAERLDDIMRLGSNYR